MPLVRTGEILTTEPVLGASSIWPRAVTMSQIAEQTGIGRATLYKYFPDVDTILHTWHAQQIDAHLRQLAQVRDRAGSPGQRLAAVLAGYADIAHRTRRHDAQLVTFLHPAQQVAHARRQLHDMVADLIADGTRAGELRDDIPQDELASYCLHLWVPRPTCPLPPLSSASSPPPSPAYDRHADPD
jgi:AcrR family transcriptional regulator